MNELEPKQVVEPELVSQEENTAATIDVTEQETSTETPKISETSVLDDETVTVATDLPETAETPKISEVPEESQESINVETEQEVVSNTESEVQTEQETEAETKIEPEVDLVPETEIQADLETQPEPEAETEPKTDLIETETQAETATEVETEIEQKAEVKPEPEITATSDLDSLTLSELVDYLRKLVDDEVTEVKQKVELVKQIFYRKFNAAAAAARQQFIADGGNEGEFKIEKDENEEALKSLLNEFRQKKAKYNEQQDKDKENNLLQKQHILQQMRTFIESNEDVSTFIAEFKNLQQKWKTIGQIPATHNTEIWKQYGRFQELFWDLVKLNNEFRELDFRKNWEAKILLCENAERLENEENVVAAFQTLQKLHNEWHELGPVQRELREEIWTRFKNASAVVNKKHQAYFETVRQDENDNLAAKTEICEKAEAFDFSNFKSYNEWEDGTSVVIALQNDWKKIGFASRKYNQKIFDRFRRACDAFFAAKSDFYKEEKTLLAQNLEKKITLCKKAEELKDSAEWKETAEKIMELQKEWKTIGRVARKQSDIVWKRFIDACDYFFEQKAKNSSGQHNAELENLEKKKAIIAQLENFEYTGNNAESIEKIKQLVAEWNEIGHVPFRDKEKMYKAFRAQVDKHFDALKVDQSARRSNNFRRNGSQDFPKQNSEEKTYRDRDRLVRSFEHLKQEIATYENNFGFLTQSTKKGSGLIQQMEQKIESLKAERDQLEQKIKLMDENN
ncbi:MAG: DUF349 domain-containing protein [Paludibacter sp.]|jgi:hypothetical protein|nr:DUF349 domain-containing protein [Paludibacter sp.]